MNLLRVMLVVLVLGAAVVVAYALFIDLSSAKLPLLVAALAVFGLASGILGFGLAGSAVRLAEIRRDGAALGVAFLGGLFVMAAAGALAGAIVLGILTAG